MGALQDALLKAGLAEENQRKPRRQAQPDTAGSTKAGKRPGARPGKKKPRAKPDQAASDLARAYAAREKAEAREKEQKKRQRVEAQEARRRRNLELDSIIQGATLNRKEADCPRYFEHLGRIRRVMCTPEQRSELNAGQIGVVNLRGSYLLVSLETMAAFRQIAPDLVPDLSGSEPEDDGSNYPAVPDDLVW